MWRGVATSLWFGYLGPLRRAGGKQIGRTHSAWRQSSTLPKNKGKKSYQPILTFLAETHEYVWGELRNGDRPDGKQIARHLQSVSAALPKGIETSSRGPIPVSLAGRPCKPTKKPRRTSSSWPARPRVCWNNCKPPTGSPGPRPML